MGKERDKLICRIGGIPLSDRDLSDANLMEAYYRYYRERGVPRCRSRDLRGDHRERSGPAPEGSSYTNGLNEIARLYLEVERVEDGLKYHELALATTTDPDHHRALKTDIAPFLEMNGLPDS